MSPPPNRRLDLLPLKPKRERVRDLDMVDGVFLPVEEIVRCLAGEADVLRKRFRSECKVGGFGVLVMAMQHRSNDWWRRLGLWIAN